ncbi:MAG TPA: hypothetical protein VKY31_16745 [Terriglobia bacterium]|nr:hypothetical protein [Terriglobia bacterium]
MNQSITTKNMIWLFWMSVKGLAVLMLLWAGSAARILYQNF